MHRNCNCQPSCDTCPQLDCSCPNHCDSHCKEISCDVSNLGDDTYLWLHVTDSCGKETFEPFSYTCLKDQLVLDVAETIDLSSYATTAALTVVINGLRDELCLKIDDAIAGITFPPPDLSSYVQFTDLATALADYYTRTQVNNIIDGLQTTINNLQVQIDDLQTQINDCCAGTPFVAPSADWANILSPTATGCSQVAEITDTNATFTYTASWTGSGLIDITVNGVVVATAASSPQAFTADAGETVQFCMTTPTSGNEVGLITVTYDDGTNSGVLDTLQYDVTGAVIVVNQPPVSSGCADVSETEGTLGFSLDVSTSFSDPDGDMLTHSAVGLPASLVISNAGIISGDITDAVGTYPVTVTADDGNGGTVYCTFDFEITAAAVIQSFTTSRIFQIASESTAPDESTGAVMVGSIVGNLFWDGTSYTYNYTDTIIKNEIPVGDNLNVTGSPDETGPAHNVPNVGEEYITRPSNPSDIQDYRVTQISGDIPTESQVINPNGPYTLGDWIIPASNRRVVVGYVTDSPGPALSGVFLVEIRYTDSQVITAQITITSETN